MNQRYLDYNNTGSGTWTFMTVQHWGEAPQGQWTLKMVVAAYSDINVCAGVHAPRVRPVQGITMDMNVSMSHPRRRLLRFPPPHQQLLPLTEGWQKLVSSITSTTAAIAGGVAAGAVLVGIVVAIVIKRSVLSASPVAPAAA
ncbi:hypothetical protein ACJMK2_007739 [Sinanodonta woodiana]|uniref:P/Homo B domain-containing protein n=1 Tax=Sinanodonta woodiana TaxID=1069815 RepID=A0ABD3VMM9_SINWO